MISTQRGSTDGLSTPTSAYVYVTIGSVLPIETIRWVSGAADIGDDLTIQVSNDKAVWSNIHTAGNAPVGEWQVATFSNLNAKYVRWRYTNPNSDPVIGGLAEVEIYGPGAYTGPAAGTPTATATPTMTPVPSETQNPASPEPITTETPPLVETATATPVDIASPVAAEPTEPAVELTPTLPVAQPTPYPVAQISRSASTLPGTMAVDGNPETIWRTIPGGVPGRVAVLTLDLGESREIGNVRILPGRDGLLGRATIETSQDGVIWTFFAEPASVATEADGWLIVGPGPDVPSPVAARYVRVVFVSNGEPLGGIAEIEIVPPE